MPSFFFSFTWPTKMEGQVSRWSFVRHGGFIREEPKRHRFAETLHGPWLDWRYASRSTGKKGV